jgi:hypothetical protein
MTDETQPGGGPPGEDQPLNELADELRALGQNLQAALKSAWESEERKKLKSEIETGLNDLTRTLSQAAKEFNESPTGQTLKADVEDFQQRLRAGELEQKVRGELLGALRSVNNELQKAIHHDKDAPSE